MSGGVFEQGERLTSLKKRSATYSERLRVPVRWWIQGSLLVASFWVAMIVAIPGTAAWGISAALMTLLAWGLSSYGHARVVVEDGWLRAGRARIEIGFLGDVEALDAAETRELSGPQADARAFLLLRPYLSQAVRIEIEDPGDPTPYWLVSSRRPARLAAALNYVGRRPAVPPDTHPGPLEAR